MTPLPLHILHVVPYYEQAWAYGGIPRLATTMTHALARRGHHVTVYTTDVRDAGTRATSATAPHQRVEVRMFPNVSNTLAYHLQFFTPIGLRARLKATASTFDIAHLHACHNLPGVIAAAELSRAGVPYVVSPNGTARPIERRVAAKRLFAMTLGRRMLAEAARVVAVSRAEAAQLGTLGVDTKSIAFIPNPIDEQEFERIPDGAQFRATLGVGRRPLLLFLGKLTPRKGVDHLVRAFSALDRSDAVLVVAGHDMGAGPAVDALVRRLNLERRVFRPGLLTGPDRLDALAAANVVAYPSRDEVFGLVPLEALLCGTPVVVCDGHPRALSEAMASILMSERLWRRRAVAAGTVARRLFGAGIVCGQLESLYASVLAESVNDRRLPA